MPLPDPAWKKKTRPCPFYSQGRCLFADSCNFLHEVKIKASVDADALTLTRSRNGLPTVTVDSPMATRSPPRSPRMSSLLSVLEGVIGPDDTGFAQGGALGEKVGQARVVEGLGGLALSGMSAQSRRVVDEDSVMYWTKPNDTKRPAPLNLSNADVFTAASQESPTHPAETDVRKSTDTLLLSPVDLASGASLGVPFPPLDLDAALNREDSLDSTSSENWVGPVPLALSPPRYRPASTFDLLASPFGSPSRRAFPPGLGPLPSPRTPHSPLRSPFFAATQSTPSHERQESVDSVDEDVPVLSSHHHQLSSDSSVGIHSDSFELIRPPPGRGDGGIIVRDEDAHLVLPASRAADETSDESNASNASSERLSFPYPPASVPVPEEAGSHLQIHVLDDVPRTASFNARFSLAQVMKESLVKRPHRTWQDLAPALQEVDEDEEVAGSTNDDRSLNGIISSNGNRSPNLGPLLENMRHPSLSNDPSPVGSASSLDGGVFSSDGIYTTGGAFSSSDQSPSGGRPRAVSELTLKPRLSAYGSEEDPETPDAKPSLAYLESSPVAPASTQDDTITEMYETYMFSPEEAAAKRMSWMIGSRDPMPPGPQLSPLAIRDTRLSQDSSDEFERIVQEELAIDESDAGGSGSRQRIRTFSPATSVSSRSLSRAGSTSSQSAGRRPRSLLITGAGMVGSRIHSPLSASIDKGKGRMPEEPVLNDSDGGSSDSYQHVYASSPAASISSRTGSRAGSASSQSGVRRSLLLANKGTSDDRIPSPLSASSYDKGKGRVSPQPSSSISSVGSMDALSKKVPFGFRNSFKGKPIQTRSRPTSVITSVHTPSSYAGSLPGSDAPPSSNLRPLRLSRIFDSGFSLPSSSRSSAVFIAPSLRSSLVQPRSAPLSHSQSLSSTRSSLIPAAYEHHDTDNMLPLSPHSSASHAPPFSAPLQSWRAAVRASSHPFDTSRPSSRLSEPIHTILEDDDLSNGSSEHMVDATTTIRRPLPLKISTRPAPASDIGYETPPTPATSAPTLMFAIASDDPTAVRAVLERGDVGPNDDVGPQSALAFALTADGLSHRSEIVKTLLAFGADPAVLADPTRNPPRRDDTSEDGDFGIMSPPRATALDGMDPATRYYISRAGANNTRRASALIRRSFFRPITRARYDVVGQDRVFEQLFLVLNQHSRALVVAPLVVILCGPSGHGKSLLARKFASLLDVPAHTVNVTTLQSTHDLWQSHSMSPYEEPSTDTLAQFLQRNEGNRCVVVLDEIEKTDDPKVLYPLLMPWELGRCSLKAGDRHVDVRNVVWIGTSNVGHDLVFEFEPAACGADGSMSRADYLKLTDLLRPKVSERLGASLVSRVTSVLPFIPFTHDEQMAIATEALYSVGGSFVTDLDVDRVAQAARSALSRYVPSEGARSLYRAASAVLLEMDPLDDADGENMYL